jgi:hypothetical protein
LSQIASCFVGQTQERGEGDKETDDEGKMKRKKIEGVLSMKVKQEGKKTENKVNE